MNDADLDDVVTALESIAAKLQAIGLLLRVKTPMGYFTDVEKDFIDGELNP